MTSSPRRRNWLTRVGLILLLALIVRLIFVYPQFSGDVKNHLVWGHSVLEEGPAGLFSRHFPGYNDANYPPLTIYLFGACVFSNIIVLGLFNILNQAVGAFPSMLVPLFQSFNMQAAFAKLPAIFADLGIGYLIYKISHRKFLAVLYLFNPAVIYISSVWGQIESLPVFFILLSLFLLPRRYYLSHLAFVLAILSKQTALWVAPVFLILWWKEKGSLKLIRGLLFQLAAFLLIYLPFTSPFNAVGSYLSTLSGSSDSVTDQAFNLWYFIYGWSRQSDLTLLLGLSVRTWSLILLSLAYLVICFRFIKKGNLKSAANYLFFLSLAAFFLQTRVHDRHLAPALPFLLLSTFPFLPKVGAYLLLSAYHMINLYLALRLPFI